MESTIHNQITEQLSRLPSSRAILMRRVSLRSSEVIELEVTICDQKQRFVMYCFQSGIDLVPVHVNDEDVYDKFDLESMPALCSWDPSDLYGLCNVIAAIREASTSFYRRGIETNTNFDAIRQKIGLEVCVQPRASGKMKDMDICLNFPLFEKNDGTDSRLLPIRMMIRAPNAAPNIRHVVADVTLILPFNHEMRLTGTYSPKQWELSESLYNYLPAVQGYIRNSWSKRKELVESLVATYNVLEYDNIDFSTINLLAKQKRGKHSILRIVELSFKLDFPEKPPQITIHEFSGSGTWKLDPALYRYSPRWTAHRMGEELLVYALTYSNGPWTI
jgi:hypothetical protein